MFHRLAKDMFTVKSGEFTAKWTRRGGHRMNNIARIPAKITRVSELFITYSAPVHVPGFPTIFFELRLFMAWKRYFQPATGPKLFLHRYPFFKDLGRRMALEKTLRYLQIGNFAYVLYKLAISMICFLKSARVLVQFQLFAESLAHHTNINWNFSASSVFVCCLPERMTLTDHVHAKSVWASTFSGVTASLDSLHHLLYRTHLCLISKLKLFYFFLSQYLIRNAYQSQDQFALSIFSMWHLVIITNNASGIESQAKH